MTRLFTANFQIIGCREADKPENQLYKILTKGSGQSDELALMREDEKRYEADEAAMPEMPKPWGAEQILESGVIQASQTREGLEQWRQEHVTEQFPFPTAEESACV